MRHFIGALACLLFTAAPLCAHDGAFVFFTDQAGTQCGAQLGMYQSAYLYLYYLRGVGPEMGFAAYFRLVSSSPTAIVTSPEWSSDITQGGGDIWTGVTLTSKIGDMGIGKDAVYLGRVTVYNIGDPDTFSVFVGEAPNHEIPAFIPPFEPAGRFVTFPCKAESRTYTCDPTNYYAAGGGSFTFNTSSGSCIPDSSVPPRVEGVYAVTPTEIELWFNKPLSQETAGNLSNYGVEGPTGIEPPAITSASLVGDGRCVLLTISYPLARGSGYAFYVKDVEDLEGNKHPKGGRKGLFYDTYFHFDARLLHRYEIECNRVDVAVSISNAGWRHSNGFCLDAWTVGFHENLGCILTCDSLAAKAIVAETLSFDLPADGIYRELLVLKIDDCGGTNEPPSGKTGWNLDYIHSVPRITSIVDVPNDHGGWVTVNFKKCPVESYMIPYHVERYDVYRYGPPWELVGSVPVQGRPSYAVNVPTLFNYMPGMPIPYTTYRVLAVTCDPAQQQYYESCADSGYSFDNAPIGTLVQNYEAAAMTSGLGIELKWTLASADAALAYYITRAEGGSGVFVDLAAPEVASDGLACAFADNSVESGTSYIYRVGYFNGGTRTLLFETKAVTAPAAALALDQNVPNPFNPVTTIRYRLPAEGLVSLGVFDVAGKEVARLVEGRQNAGPHTLEWKGCDGAGRPVASGVYFCRIAFGKESINRKMILLR